MFGRKKQPEKEQKSKFDKIIMGAIIGTAIGSVIGLTVAPKKGSETREQLKEAYQNRGKFFEKGREKLSENKGEIEEIGKLTKETVGGIGVLIKNFLFGKRKSAKPDRGHRSMKKIPFETEIETESESESTFKNRKD